VRGGSSYTTDIAGSFSSVGDVSPAQITIGGGQASAVFAFTALATGHTTLTASVPAGFSQPSGAANTLAVNVASSTLVVPSVTVGRNLQVPATIRMTSPAPGGGISVTVASSSADKVLFSPTADGAGAESITLAIAGGRTSTAEFYVQALGNSGSVTYTATAPGLGVMSGTVSLAPSGFVLYGPFGLGADFFTTPGAGLSGLTVYPALLDSTTNVVELQQIRGGMSVDVDIASSNPLVGMIAASPVRFTGGAAYADTQFQPAISGTTVLSITTPAGYSVPSRHSSLTATVRAPGIGVEDGVVIGKNLQAPGMVLLGEPAPSSGLSLTLTSNSGQLLLSASPTAAGSASITIDIPAGQSSAPFVMQAFAESGTATYTVAAPGYGSRSATVSFAPSGIVIAGPLGPGFPLSMPVSAAGQEVTVSTALLDPDTGSYVMSQPLAGGTELAVSLTSSDSAVASIQSTVTIHGGTDSVVMPFTLLSAGSVTLAVETPAGFTTPRNFTNLVVLATE
jgi:hypothetical protein